MERKARILVVDDEQSNVKLLEANLLLQGYEVMTVSNGEEALNKVLETDADLILLDVMMPGIDGFEVTRRLKSDENTRLIPIVLITALKEREDRIKGIEAGCDDFISKPFDKNELLARVKSLLRIKSLQDELEDKYNQLKKLEEMKDSLTHMIVHDLNNPLLVISGRLQLLQMEEEGTFKEGQERNIEEALLATQELKIMIGTLLDINKMEAGRLQLNYENFNLGDIVREVVDQMNVIAEADEKTIKAEIVENIPVVLADKGLIKRVIANLIGNAIKFTLPKGSIQIKVVYNSSNNSFYTTVKDTGGGISEEYLGRIFDKFVQVQSQKVKTGRGLGLTFCKMAVEAHGGKIWVESEPNKGSIFIFTLPHKN